MKLNIGKLSFIIESLLINEHGGDLVSDALNKYIADMQDELAKAKVVIATMPDDNLAPAAPAEPVFEIVEAANLPYTIEQYKASGWTEPQLLAEGHLIKREVTTPDNAAPAPAAEATPAPPPMKEKVVVEGQFELEGQLYMMTAKAAGASYEQFKTSGWAIEALLSEGYATAIGGDDTVQEAPETEERKFPFLNAAGDWEDKGGTIWDADKHSMSTATKVPPVTTAGMFKKTRKRATTPDVPKNTPDAPANNAGGIPEAPGTSEAGGIPEAPGASEASGIPSAPGASEASGIPSAPSTGGDDEPLDSELENIVKNW